MSHLVDTDRVIDYLGDRGNARAVLAPLIAAQHLSTSIMVLAEVLEGLIGRPERSSALSVFDEFLTSVPVVGITEATARSFASLRLVLRSTGQLIKRPRYLDRSDGP